MGSYGGQLGFNPGASGIEGNYGGSRLLGWAATGIGDINGDGIDDYLVTDPQGTVVREVEGSGYSYFDYVGRGAAYVVFGDDDGPVEVNVSELDGTNGFVLSADGGFSDFGQSFDYNQFGQSAAGLGDLNGDGYADLGVVGRGRWYYGSGGSGYSSGYGGSGYGGSGYGGSGYGYQPSQIAYVMFGRDAFDAVETVGEEGSADGFRIVGGAGIITRIGNAGDVNGDGTEDILLTVNSLQPYSDPYYSGDTPVLGYVVFGGTALDATIVEGVLDLGDIDGTNGFEIRGETGAPGGGVTGNSAEGGYYAIQSAVELIAAGDVNGDGYDDVLVHTQWSRSTGTYTYTYGSGYSYGEGGGYYEGSGYYYGGIAWDVTQRGRLYEILGDANGGASGGVAYADESLGAANVTRLQWGLVDFDYGYSTTTYGSFFSGYSGLPGRIDMRAVDGIGDVDGDGFDDVGVEGSVDVALGTASGLPDGYYGDPASLTVTDTSDGFGERRVTDFGYEFSAAGDVNGDGIDDALVHARGDIDGDFGYQNALVYLVFGDTTPSSLNLDEDADGLDGNAYLFHGLTDGSGTRRNSYGYYGEGFYGEGGRDVAPFRQWLQPAGDINDDGYADFIIGAVNGLGTGYSGRYSQGDDASFVIFGGPDALEALDNADGIDDNIIDIRNIAVDVETGVAPIRVGFNFNPDFFVGDQEEPFDPESGPTLARFVIERTGDLTSEVSVDWSVGLAGFFSEAEPEDFEQAGAGDPVFPSGTVTFAAGARTAVIEFAIADDLEDEGAEYFTLTLDAVTGPEGVPTILDDTQTTAFITDNDRPANITVGNFFFAEDDGTVEIFFNRSGDLQSVVDFTFEITSAVPFFSSSYEPADGDDVSLAIPFTGTGQIAAGVSFTSFSFDIIDDTVDEAFYQTLQVEITGATATGGLGTVTGVGDTGFVYIEDNDEAAEIRVFGQNVTEGEGPLLFTIARSGGTASPIEITYEIVADGFNPAESEDIDGGLPQGPFTVTIGAAETEALVEVGVVDDTLQNEPFDAVRLNILSAVAEDGQQVTIVTGSDEAGIIDDDIPVNLSTNSPSATEGQTISLTIFRSGDTSSEVEVDYRILPYVFNASIAAEDADFGALTPADDDGVPGLPYEGTVMFGAGDTSATITLETIDDDEIEGTEYLSWELVAARSAETSQFSLETGYDTITINDNDFPVRLSVSDPITTEGGDLVFTVTRSNVQSDTQAAFDVGYVIEPNTATNADLVGDPLTQTGTLSFAAGEFTKQVTISTVEDNLVEGQESIRFALTGASSSDPGVVFEGDGDVGFGRINDRVVDIDIDAASATEGTDDALSFRITRSGITDIDVTFDLLLEPAPYSAQFQASADDIVGDLPRTETITFAAGETEQFLEVGIVDDALIETFEYVRLSLVAGSGSSVADPDAPIDLTDAAVDGLIVSDDVPVDVSVSANTVQEGSGQPLVFTFTRTDDNDVGATVNYLFGSDPFAPAVNGDDLVGGFPAPGSVYFAPGETTKTVEIEVSDDLDQEPNEELRVSIVSVEAEGFETTGAGRAADGRIDNDDQNVEVAIESLSADEDGGPVQVTIRRSGDTDPAIEVSYLAALGSFAGSAQAADLAETLPLTGTVAFASGQTVQTFTLTPVDDELTEAPELVELRVTSVTVTDGSGAPVAFDTSPAFLTIVDDDDPIRISLRDDIQGNEDDGPIAITFESLDGSGNRVALTQDVEITYQIFNISLEADDIAETLPITNQTVTMFAGQSSAEVVLTPVADSTVETDERAQITILDAQVVSGPADTLVQFDTLPSDLVVRNDDTAPPPPPAVIIRANAASATEGDDLVYTVTRSGRTDVEVSVDYTFANSSTSDADFSDTSQFSGRLTFAPNQTVQTVRIGTVDDTLVEGTEYGFLRLSNASSPTASAVLDVQSWQAWAYLYDNDDNIELRISDDRVTEGDGQDLEFRVTRSGELDADVEVTVEITGLTADDDDVDVTLPYTETVSFAPFETVKIISIPVTDDDEQEPDEFVQATITGFSTTSGFEIVTLDGTANGEIENDDLDVAFSVRATPVSVSEGGTLIFEISRTGDLTGTDVVTYSFAGGGSDPAESDDVVGGLPQTGQTITFTPGQTRAVVTLDTVEDTIEEGNEGVTLTIDGATTTSGKTVSGIGAQATSTILNDDFPVRFDLRATNTLEDSGFLSYTVTRSGNTSVAASVTYTLSGALGDLVGTTITGDTLSFAAGQTSRTVFVQPIADAIPEPDEVVTMTLSGASATGVSATGDGRQASGVILNDDETPTITVSGGGSIVEGDTGVTPITVTFTRTGDLTDEASVQYTLAGTLDSQDIIGTVGTQNLTFGVGEAARTVTVNVLGDTFPEARTETLAVTINSVGSSAGVPYDVQGSAFISVRDDDARPPIVPTGFEADIFGDPHIVTLDGLTYSFMAVGEFILLETVPGAEDPFQVQVRFEPAPGSSLVSVTTRMAVEVDGVTVEIDAKTKQLLIDGEVTVIDPEIGALDITGDGTADVYRVIDEEGKETYFIVLNDMNEQLMVGLFDAGFMNVCVFLDESRASAVQGLMGNADGNDQNEFALRDGTPFAEEPEFEVLYGEFADSWRLDDPSVDGSTKVTLFTYEEGQDTSSFDDPNFPAADIDLAEVPADILAAARQAARDAGIEGVDDPNDPDYNPIFEAAVLDFVFTGLDTGGATLAAEPTGNVATFVSAAPPTMFTNVGAVTPEGASSPDIVEGDSGVTPVQFRFYRTDSTGTSMTVHYAISGVDLADIANGSLTGTLAFGETETEAFLQVDVLGDLLTEDDEEIVVTITGVSDGQVGAATARVTVETDDFAPESVDDTLSIDQGETLQANVLVANPTTPDSDPDLDTLTVLAVNGTALGSDGTETVQLGLGALTIDANGSVEYTPDAGLVFADGEVKTDTFEYTIGDGNGGEDTAEVTISIVSIGTFVANTGPDAVNDSETTTEGEAVVIDVLANDTDDEDDELSIKNFGSSAGGTVAQNEDGTLTFTPTAGPGIYSFEYTATDGSLTDTATVTVTVEEAPEEPLNVIDGTPGADNLTGTDARDVIDPGAGPGSILAGGLEADIFVFALEDISDAQRARHRLTDFDNAEDVILVEGTVQVAASIGRTVVQIDNPDGGPNDLIYLLGEFSKAELNLQENTSLTDFLNGL